MIRWAADPLPDARDWPFGTELVLNLAGCDPSVIGNRRALRRWVNDLCKLIGMRRHGRARLTRFGEGDLVGWTVVQLITTSSVVAHCRDSDRSAFVNVFSCRAFDTEAAARFTAARFGAAAVEPTILTRRAPNLPDGVPAGE